MPRLTTPRALLAALLLAGACAFLPAAQAHAAVTHQVVMSGYAFAPRSLTVAAGDTVTWVNRDQAPHDVKTTSGPQSIHSPMLSKGGTWSHTFTVPGAYGYVCTVHPGMTAQLVVKAAAAPTRTARPTTHEHPATTTAVRPTTRAPQTHSTSSHAQHSGEAAPAPDSTAPSGTASTASAQPAVAAENASSTTRPLDPLLLLAGVVAGVSVLCLLLVGSRSAAATPRKGEGDERTP